MSMYTQEEVYFENKNNNIVLSGTLTLPDKKAPFPAVILISGMGPNDRDYTMADHKLFLVLADYLTRHGIAVLRYDKRGVGKSTGTFNTSLTSKDFANDVLAAIGYIKKRKEIDPKKIGLIGHSEGGMIAPMVAEKSTDIAFIILLAGALATSIDSNIAHVSMQLRADGATEDMIAIDQKIRRMLLEIIMHEDDHAIAAEKLHQAIENYLNNLTQVQVHETEKLPFAIKKTNAEDIIAIFNSPWYRYFLSYNPISTLQKITIPVLAINGDRDFISSPDIILPIVSQALQKASNTNYKIIKLPNLNHWLQTCKTGALAEYGTSEETMAPQVLQIITQWIKDQTNNKN